MKLHKLDLNCEVTCSNLIGVFSVSSILEAQLAIQKCVYRTAYCLSFLGTLTQRSGESVLVVTSKNSACFLRLYMCLKIRLTFTTFSCRMYRSLHMVVRLVISHAPTSMYHPLAEKLELYIPEASKILFYTTPSVIRVSNVSCPVKRSTEIKMDFKASFERFPLTLDILVSKVEVNKEANLPAGSLKTSIKA